MRTFSLVSRIALAATVISIAVACGGGSDPQPSPTPLAASVELSASASGPLVSIGDTRTLTATVRDANNETINNATVSYSSGNTGIATVSGSGTTATITAVGNGTTLITATSGTASDTYEVTVAQRLSAVTLSIAPFEMGATVQLAPIGRDARANAISGVTGFTYTTTAASVAAVAPTGVLTAVAPGQATIGVSVTRDGVTASANANVTVTLPTALTNAADVTATTANAFNPQTVTILAGGTVTFTFQSVGHTVTFQSGGAPANIAESRNTAEQRTFPNAGTFPYICTIHAGMSGTVNVASTSLFANMTGDAERPTPTGSAATGAASFTRVGDVVNYIITWQGLSSAPTGLHIHGPASSSQTGDVIVPIALGGQTGTIGALTGSFTASAIQGVDGQPPMSLDALITLMQNGNAYINLHSTNFPDGEIRGQLGMP